jgi:hypothetical protein
LPAVSFLDLSTLRLTVLARIRELTDRSFRRCKLARETADRLGIARASVY